MDGLLFFFFFKLSRLALMASLLMLIAFVKEQTSLKKVFILICFDFNFCIFFEQKCIQQRQMNTT
jgi:hypothetical protein